MGNLCGAAGLLDRVWPHLTNTREPSTRKKRMGCGVERGLHSIAHGRNHGPGGSFLRLAAGRFCGCGAGRFGFRFLEQRAMPDLLHGPICGCRIVFGGYFSGAASRPGCGAAEGMAAVVSGILPPLRPSSSRPFIPLRQLIAFESAWLDLFSVT
jgi:hypothetical protein